MRGRARIALVLPLIHCIPTLSPTTLDVSYQVSSYFLGLTLSEHFYFIFTGSWSLLLAISLLRAQGEKVWLGWLGVVAGTFLLLASFEQLNFSFGNILVIFVFGGALLWLVWVVSLAFTLLTNRPKARYAENRI